MPLNEPVSDKRRALLAHKDKILQDIKYYEQRLQEFGANASSKVYFEEGDSSDSDDDFPIKIDNGPAVPELKVQQAVLRTCLQATQELTSLQVLQSEINVMVEDPVMKGEPLVTEPGLWRDVAAECRIDLVPFSIIFCVHQPNRKFAPSSYRCVKVLPVKIAHETELAKSILPSVTRPSDAIEVLRNYAAAYRSRRTTLARLADKYAHNLFMEPMTEGGYMMKCANLLEVSWRLENKWSPIAAFHHRMKFDIEYMDESYIKIITQAHKQLSDPSLGTDERTILLSKIISTCLEAQGPTQELYESMESDPESVRKLEKRRTTLDQDEEAPYAKKKKEQEDVKAKEKAMDDQIMAPPKSLPKKVKPKGKENVNDNRKSVKRSNVEDENSNKRAKIDEALINIRESVDQIEAGRVQNRTGHYKGEKSDQNVAKTVEVAKNLPKTGVNQKTAEIGGKNLPKNVANQKNVAKKANKDNEKIKDAKKPKKDAKEVVSEVNNQQNNKEKSKNVTEQTKNTNEGQERAKKKESPKDLGENIASKDNLPSSTKENALIKKSDAKKVPNEDKTANPSKNNPKTESKSQKVANKETDPKNDQNMVEKKIKKNNTQLLKEQPKQQTSNTDKDPNEKAEKISKNKKSVQTNEKSSKDVAKSDIEINKNKNLNVNNNKSNEIDDTKISNGNDNNINNDKSNKVTKIDHTANTKKVNDNTKTNSDNIIIPKSINNNSKVAKNDLTTRNKNTTDKTKINSDNTKIPTNNKNNINDNKSNKVAKNDQTTNINNATDKTKTNTDSNKKSSENTKYTADNTKQIADNTKKTAAFTKKTDNAKNTTDNVKKIPKNLINKHELTKKPINQTNDGKNTEIKTVKNVKPPQNTTEKTKAPKISEKNVTNNKNTENAIPKNVTDDKKTKTNEKQDKVEKTVKVKNVAATTKEHIADRKDAKSNIKIGEALKNKMVIKNLSHKNLSAQSKLPKTTDKERNLKSGNAKTFKTGNGKMNGSATKMSKIPQKKLSPISESAIKKNPLRISPRKIASAFKSTSDSCIKQRFEKPNTNIPRLMKKPVRP